MIKVKTEIINQNYVKKLDAKKLQNILELVQFDQKDEQILINFFNKIVHNIPDMIDKFYNRLLVHKYPKSFFSDDKMLSQVKEKQIYYFRQFFTEKHDTKFFESRKQLGSVHEKIGLDNLWYLSSYELFFEMLADETSKESNGYEILKSIGKIMFIDIGVAIESYIDAREDVIYKKTLELNKVKLHETIGKFTGGIVHDFNNYLSNLSGYMELLQIEEDLSENSKNLIGKMSKTLDKSSGLINQLQMYNKNQMIKLININLNSLILDMSIDQEKRFSNIEIILELDSNLNSTFIKGDQSQVNQILLNLLINAAESISGKTGKISIVTKYIQYSKFFDDDCINLSIIDNGIGINKEIENKIFEPFFSNKNNTGNNLGLGLSIVFSIVKQMDGEISITSGLHSGTRIDTFFPISKSETQLSTKRSIENTKIEISDKSKFDFDNKKVLLVEDNKDLLFILSSILEKANLRVSSAINGKEALYKYNQFSDFSLIITDIMLPDINGRELVNIIRNKLGNINIKVLFMSGYTKDIMDLSLLNEITKFIPKPFSFEQFQQEISNLLTI